MTPVTCTSSGRNDDAMSLIYSPSITIDNVSFNEIAANKEVYPLGDRFEKSFCGFFLIDVRPKKVVFHDPATVVYWSDGTKTVVKCGPHDTFDPEKGLAMAVAKKHFGNGNEFHKVFKRWVPDES